MNMKQHNRNKNQLFIGATVQPIQNCQFLASCDDTTLFIHKRSLIVMNLALHSLKSCLIEDQKILSATYYSSLQVFVVNTDKYLIIINKQAQIINRLRIPELLQAKSLLILTMQDGYQGIPYHRKDQLFFFTNQYMFQVPISVNYERSLLKSKSLCSISIQFTQKPNIVHFQWTAYFVYLQKVRLLICWNQTEAYIFQTPNQLKKSLILQLTFDKILKRTKLYESDNKINSFEASLKHRLLIAAFQLGSIKVYKLDETKKYICELRGHQRECTGLFINGDEPDLLYSCGLDNSIRVWELMDFGQVYHIRFDIICSRVFMMSQKLIFAKSIDNRRAFFVKLNTGVLNPVLSQAKPGRLVHLLSDGQWGISLYSNNFIQAFLLGEYKNENRQFNEKIQFPIKYGFLRSAYKVKDETFAICMQRGFTILKLNKDQSQGQNFQLKRLVYNHSLQVKPNQKGKLIQLIHEKLLDTFFFTILSDWKGIPIAINVTSVSFLLNTQIPKWDIDVKGKNLEGKSDYVILGNDRGYIFFVSIKNKNQYHTRVNFHSDEIISVEQINIKNSKQLNFLSRTVSQQIGIWSLSDQKGPCVLLRLSFTKDISVMKTADFGIAIGCKSGQFSIFQIDQNEDQPQQVQFSQCQINREEGHLKSIISIDFLMYKGERIWLTGGEDYAIKLWRDIYKQLIIQIRIFSMINYVIFAKRDIDIIMSHGENGQISVLTSKNIHQLEQVKSELENKKHPQQLSLTKIDIRNFFCPVDQPSSPRKKQKDPSRVPQQSNGKKSQIEQLIKFRSIDKIEGSYLQNSERRMNAKKDQKSSKNPSPIKDTQNLSNSIILPKIGNKFSFFGSSRRYKQQTEMKGSKILQKMSTSRIKSYSQAGRKNM